MESSIKKRNSLLSRLQKFPWSRHYLYILLIVLLVNIFSGITPIFIKIEYLRYPVIKYDDNNTGFWCLLCYRYSRY